MNDEIINYLIVFKNKNYLKIIQKWCHDTCKIYEPWNGKHKSK